MQTDNPYQTSLKGMTIFKAFLLVFLCVIFIHVIGFFYQVGFLYSLFETFLNDNPGIQIKLNTYSYIISYAIFTFIGFRVNNNELPFFKSAKRTDYLKVIVLAMLWNVVGVFLIQIFGDNNIGYVNVNQDFTEVFQLKGLFRPMSFLLSVFFLIGTVGHGLLRNYNFMTVMIVIPFFALPYLNPIIVIAHMLMCLLFIYIYYISGAFQLLIIFAVVSSTVEFTLAYFYSPSELRYGNIIKDHLTGDSGFYYLFMFLVISIYIWVLYSFKNSKNPHSWERKLL